MIGVRPYRHPEDFQAVCRVHDRARPDELRGSVPAAAFRTMAEVAGEEEFFESETVVACEGGTVVGFASWRGTYVTWPYVEPAYYRRGVGSMLMREVLRETAPQTWLNTLAGTAAAIAFYRRHGLKIVKEFASECDGFPCRTVRMALAGSAMADPGRARGE